MIPEEIAGNEAMTVVELWDEYQQNACLSCETPAEIALQKSAWLCGMICALGTLIEIDHPHKIMIEMGKEAEVMANEASKGIRLQADLSNRPSDN